MKVLVELITNEHKHIFQKVEEEQIKDNKEMWDNDDSLVGYVIWCDVRLYYEEQTEKEELKSRLATIQAVAKGEI